MCLIPPAEEEIVLGNGKNLEMLLERGGYLLVLLQRLLLIRWSTVRATTCLLQPWLCWIETRSLHPLQISLQIIHTHLISTHRIRPVILVYVKNKSREDLLHVSYVFLVLDCSV